MSEEVKIIEDKAQAVAAEVSRAQRLLSLTRIATSLWQDYVAESFRTTSRASREYLDVADRMDGMVTSKVTLQAWSQAENDREFFHSNPELRDAVFRTVIETALAVTAHIDKGSKEDIKLRARNLHIELSRELSKLASG